MLLITDGLPRGLGYVEIDQRAVPAELPPGTQRYFEADTYTCSHCQTVVIMNPQRKRERYRCHGCDHHVCDDCAAKLVAGGSCVTFAQFVEQVQERAERQPESTSIILP